MREIKFRAWDDAKKEWLLGYELPNLGGFSLVGETVVLGEWGALVWAYIDERDGHKFDDLKVMQYTGLKDKNGVEIYEGDIVRVSTDERVPLGSVVYEVDGFCTQMPTPTQTDGLWQSYMSLSSHKEPEVIGSIYENNDLLGDTTNES